MAIFATMTLAVMHLLAGAVAGGLPGWLNPVVLILAWDTLKLAGRPRWLRSSVSRRGPFATREWEDSAVQAERLLERAGGAWEADLNHYDTDGGCMATTQQIDKWVYVVGQDNSRVARYTLAEWLGEEDQHDPPFIDADDAVRWCGELFRVLREDCLVWQCGACDAWIFTSSRPRMGVLAGPRAVSPASTSATATAMSVGPKSSLPTYPKWPRRIRQPYRLRAPVRPAFDVSARSPPPRMGDWPWRPTVDPKA